MGLDTSHNCWHGPYSRFTRWRNAVAVAAGYLVAPVKYESGMTFETVQLDWKAIERANPGCYMGRWDVTPNDPLLILIVHSDCEGEIVPEHAGPLADRLEAVLPSVRSAGHDDFSTTTLQFIAGLRAAVKAGEPVDFH